MKKRPLKRSSMASMQEQLAQLLAESGSYITENYDVDALCRGAFNKRMRELRERGAGG